MGFGFPNLTATTQVGWPSAFPNPLTRGWYPPYAILLTSLATAILAARLASQFRRNANGLRLDDILICVGWLFAALFTVTTISGSLSSGFNRHMWDVPIDLYNRAALIQFLSEGAFLLSICCTKISVLLFFKRLEPTCTVTLKRIIWGVIAFTAAYTFALLLAQIFLCQHTASYWNIPRPDRPIERTCGDQDAIYILQGSLDVFSTVYSILIPCLVLRRIPLAMFQRYGLRAVAGTSVFVLGAAIARAVFLFYLTHSVSGDSTWNGFNVFVSEQLECQLAIILASAPFLQRFAPQYSGQPLPALQHTKDHSGSVVSRVSSSLSSRRWRFPFGRKHQKTEISQPLPQPAQIPEWEFETFDISQRPQSPTQNALSYDRYLAGMYGPPAPPKDSRELFEQYRREHRAVV